MNLAVAAVVAEGVVDCRLEFASLMQQLALAVVQLVPAMARWLACLVAALATVPLIAS